MYIKDSFNEDNTPTPNPDFVKFQNDFNSLLSEDRDLEYKGFKLEEFDNVETDSNYIVFFKLVAINE
jgi:hypothetical protein